MADATQGTRHGFTREQLDFLREEFAQKAAQGFDRPMLMWVIGGLVAIGIAIAGILSLQIGANRAEIGSVRAEIGSVRVELREEIRENRAAIAANQAAIAELAKGQARIEAILEERLPRDR